jgi:phospholipase D1/2
VHHPPRDDCRVTIYQDADTPALPCFDGITEPDGAPYSPTRLWIDLFNALNSAQKLIYVTGWSVFTQVFTKKKCEN